MASQLSAKCSDTSPKAQALKENLYDIVGRTTGEQAQAVARQMPDIAAKMVPDLAFVIECNSNEKLVTNAARMVETLGPRAKEAEPAIRARLEMKISADTKTALESALAKIGAQ